MATDHYDVVIIGSGAGGGTLAWKLAPDRQADPAPRARRLPPPRARQLGHRGGVPARQVHDRRRRGSTTTATSSRPSRTTTSAATPSSTAPRCSGLRPQDFGEHHPPRRHLAGVAVELRRLRAVVRRRPRTCTRCTAPPARTRPTALAAASTPTPRFARAADPAAQRRPREARPAPVAPAARRDARPGRRRRRRAHEHVHPLRPRRRLPVPGGRQGRRADRRGRSGARAPQRRARTQRQGGAARDRRRRDARSPRWWSTLADGSEARFSGDVVVVSCGALELGAAPAASANDTHPNGLANGSDQVGRNYMRHNNAAMMALSKEPNPTRLPEDARAQRLVPQGEDTDYPWGDIQMLGKSDGEQLKGKAPHFLAVGDEARPRAARCRWSRTTASTSG